MSLRLLAVLISIAGLVQAQNGLTIVSSASYVQFVSPDSRATIFGSNMAPSAAVAQPDSDGRFPTELAGTTVEIGGRRAALFYVSPTQINFLVPRDTETGPREVVVVSPSTGTVSRGSAEVRDVAPAIFTLDASGEGPAAIFNAVTYSGMPFLVETPEIAGKDKRTRLALYATGLRFAGNPEHDPDKVNVASRVRAAADTTGGDTIDLAVEFAGPAPGFPGVDQVNLVLPPHADGAGLLTLTIQAESANSNAAEFRVDLLPASAIRIAALQLSRSSVRGGESLTGTVQLNGLARFGGLPVTLRSEHPAASVPPVVTVFEGAASAEFPINTVSTPSRQEVTISASARGFNESAVVTVQPPGSTVLANISVTPETIQGGSPVSATVTLGAPAPFGGVVVNLQSSSFAARLPASLAIPAGQSAAAFRIDTTAVEAAESVTITASLGGISRTATFTIQPALTLNINPETITGGASATATVRLGSPAPVGGALVNIRADSALVRIPAFIAIPSGQMSAAFAVQTTAPSTPANLTMTASYAGAEARVSFTIRPATSSTLAGFTVTPTTIRGGETASAAVTLEDPAPFGGVTVTLRSSNPMLVQLQPFVNVPAGQTAFQFTIRTNVVPIGAQRVTLSASAGGVTREVTLTVF